MAHRGLKQRDLAQALKVEPSTVSRWVRGHDFPTEHKMTQIAEALDCSVADLYKAPEDAKTGPNLGDLAKADQILEILKNRLPDDSERLRAEIEGLKSLIGPHLPLLKRLGAYPELSAPVYAAAQIRHEAPLLRAKKGS